MRKTTDYTPALIELIGAQKLKRTTDMLLSLPIIVTVTIVGVCFAVWRTDPLIRFIHMLWVLGFWMAGTVAMFASVIRARLNLASLFPILMVTFVSILIGIYFTPLSRFTDLFPRQTGLVPPAAVGILTIMTSWLIVLRFRKKIVDAYL